MINKIWFQFGVGMLMLLVIIKYMLEINWIFTPIIIVVKTILIPLLLGTVLFYLSEPLQRVLEKRGMPRWGSISIILVLLIVSVTAVSFMIGNPISNQITKLIDSAPSIANNIQKATDYILDNRADLPPQVEKLIDTISNSIQNVTLQLTSGVLSILKGTVSTIFYLILVPFFLVYMLRDHEKFAPKIYNAFTGERRSWIKGTLNDINNVLKAYVQSQVFISLILATMMFIGYMFIGIEYALLLTIFAFFTNMVPFIGPWIGLVPAVIVAIIQDPIMVVWVCLITLVAQQVESNLISPNVMGKSLDIHPLTVITIVLAAGNISNFVGVIIAIPTYAVIKVIVINIYGKRQRIKEVANKKV